MQEGSTEACPGNTSSAVASSGGGDERNGKDRHDRPRNKLTDCRCLTQRHTARQKGVDLSLHIRPRSMSSNSSRSPEQSPVASPKARIFDNVDHIALSSAERDDSNNIRRASSGTAERAGKEYGDAHCGIRNNQRLGGVERRSTTSSLPPLRVTIPRRAYNVDVAGDQVYPACRGRQKSRMFSGKNDASMASEFTSLYGLLDDAEWQQVMLHDQA